MISIAIPTYEMHGHGVEYLRHQFNIFSKQTFQDFEVVISDHSVDDDIEVLCKKEDWIFDIIYLKYEYNRGMSSENLNNAIRHCSRKYIKILFQDDFLFNETSLEKTINCFEQTDAKHWLMSEFCHYDGTQLYRPVYPKYHDEIHFGNNTIGCPSVLALVNDDILFFDNSLVWLMDVEYYKRLYDKFGLPEILNEITVVTRTGEHQYQNHISKDIKEKELDMMRKKYIIAP